MPYYTKYHVKEQSALVLLAPIRDTLRELESRAKHFGARLNLEPGSDKTLQEALAALSRARQELERLAGTGRSTGAPRSNTNG
jgi:hypothetical protein